MASIGEEYPKQQQRVREILGQYRAIGPAGSFGAAMIEHTLREADQAVASGDVIAMIRSFEAMEAVE